VVVHAHGVPQVIDDAGWLRKHVSAMTDLQESRHPPGDWKVTDAPADFIDSMVKMIVGIEIPMLKLEGKWKMSQNREMPDREGVVAGLTARASGEDREIADAVAHATGPDR